MTPEEQKANIAADMAKASSEAIRNLTERLRGADECLVALVNRRSEWTRMWRATDTTGTPASDTPWWRAFDEAIYTARSVRNVIESDLNMERELLKIAEAKQ